MPKLYESTEEGKKVYRNKAAGQNHGDGDVRLAVFRRIAGPAGAGEEEEVGIHAW